MEAVKHNLTSHHNFHTTEDPDKLVHHGHSPAEGAKEARESLEGHGYEHIDSQTKRDFTSPRHHVYRSKDHGGWAMVQEALDLVNWPLSRFERLPFQFPSMIEGSPIWHAAKLSSGARLVMRLTYCKSRLVFQIV